MMRLTARHTFYLFVSVATILGWSWIVFCNTTLPSGHFTPCLFKNITGLPCPSCGATRSLMCISHLHFKDAVLINPIGYILGVLLLVFPAWLIADAMRGTPSMYRIFTTTEKKMQQRPFIIIMTLALIAVNWIWNIYKQL